jgi:hypothetical protein
MDKAAPAQAELPDQDARSNCTASLNHACQSAVVRINVKAYRYIVSQYILSSSEC